MNKKVNVSSVFLALTTILFIGNLIANFTGWFAYLIILILGLISSYLINNKDVLSANFMFGLFFTYSLAFSPIILMSEKITFNYSYYKIILGSFICFLWGDKVLRTQSIKKKRNNTQKYIDFPRIYVLKLLFWISEIASLVYLKNNFNNLFSGNLNVGRIESASGNGALLYVSQLSVLLIPMMYDLMKNNKQNNGKNLSKVEFYFYCFISCISLLIAGFRAPIITMLVCLIILHFKKNKISTKKIIKYGVSLIIIVELLSLARTGLSTNDYGTRISPIKSIRSTLIVNAINLSYVFNAFPNNVPFQHGYTYLINILMLLPGPDLDFTLWLKDKLSLTFAGGGVTPTILGEFYINFGVISIFIGMFFLAGIGNIITKKFNEKNYDFLGAFYIWQFAHCASGGIANVMILVILYTIVYKMLFLFKPFIKREENKIE